MVYNYDDEQFEDVPSSKKWKQHVRICWSMSGRPCFFFFFLSSPFGGCYKWRLEALYIKRLEVATCRGCDSWNLRITPMFLLVFGKAKGHSKLQLNYHRTGKGASRFEIHFFDTTSGCFFLKAFSGWKELWWFFFTGWEYFLPEFCQMTSQEESSSFATSAWIPSWKTMSQIAYKTQSFWLHPFLRY